MQKLNIITLTSLICLVGCGGASEQENVVSNDTPIVINPPVTVVEPTQPSNTVSLAGNPGKASSVKQKVAGQPLTTRAVVNDSFANAQGSIKSATGNASVIGNLTLGLTVSDPEGIKQVSLHLPNVNRSFAICSDSCLENSLITVTGFNPHTAGEQAGDLRIELIVHDLEDNESLADAISINWQPIEITSINAVREASNIVLNWTQSASAERYNIYAATDASLSRNNALTLENGIQLLAQSTTNIQFADVDEDKPYYVIITAINSAGESGMTSPLMIPSETVIINLPPIANPDEYQLNEDQIFSANVLENDSDPERNEVTVKQIMLQPNNGELELAESGEFSYTPVTNFFGNDSFSYVIVDDLGQEDETIVTLTVNSVNDAPAATDDIYTLSDEHNITVSSPGVLSNDSDIDGDRLLVEETLLIEPEFGVLDLKSDGSFIYVANSDFDLSDKFVYQISDEQGGSHFATVTILAAGDFAPPQAQNDSYQTNEDITLVVDTIANGILGNDQEPNGFQIQLTESLISEPLHGQLNLSLDGTFTYIPDSNYVGNDQFQYQISSETGKTSQATVIINVINQPDAPIAVDDDYQLSEDQKLIVEVASGLLANDSDPDGGTITVNSTVVELPSKGAVLLNADGSFEYIPTENFSGIDSFTYQISNQDDLTSQALVTLTITSSNDAPIAVDDFATTEQNSSITIDVLENDIDIDSESISIESASANVGVVNIENNKVIYQPETDFSGIATIEYIVTDNEGLTGTANVLVTVTKLTSVNNLPIANDDIFIVNEDTQLNAASVLANDNDADNDPLVVQSTPVSNVKHGTLSLLSDGTFSYVPISNFNGEDNFVYSISDGQGGFDQATVSITIDAINDLPDAVDDNFQMHENDTFQNLNVLSNDTDVDNDTLTISTTPVTDVKNGSLILTNDGNVSYTPTVTFNGSDSFIYQVNDSHGGTAQATVNIVVSSTNVAPIATNDIFDIDENTTLSGASVLDNDNDADKDQLTVITTPITDVNNGSLQLIADGTFTYIPLLNFDGKDNFVYEIKDPEGATSQATVTINIINEIVPPVAFNDSYTIITVLGIGNTLKANVLDNDYEPDGGELKVNETPVVNVQHGVLELDYDGEFEYTPNFGFLGTDSFVYEIYDDNNSSSGTSQATVTIFVVSL